MLQKDSIQSLAKDVDEFLSHNPDLKEAMDIFYVSNEEYKEAVASLTQKPGTYSSNTTSDYGDLERNS